MSIVDIIKIPIAPKGGKHNVLTDPRPYVLPLQVPNPDFDQTVIDLVMNDVFSLERLAVIGVIPPSQVDRYQHMIEAAKVVPGEVVDVPIEDVVTDLLLSEDEDLKNDE